MFIIVGASFDMSEEIIMATNCGHSIPLNAKFCPECGIKLVSTTNTKEYDYAKLDKYVSEIEMYLEDFPGYLISSNREFVKKHNCDPCIYVGFGINEDSDMLVEYQHLNVTLLKTIKKFIEALLKKFKYLEMGNFGVFVSNSL